MGVFVGNAMALDLPDGFEDASEEVKKEILTAKQSEDLVSEIRELVGTNGRSSPQLTKEDKAAILVRLYY